MIGLPLWLPSLVGVALCLGFAFRTWQLRPWQGWRWAVIAGLAVAWWCAGQFGWYLTDSLDARRLMGKLQYLGITATPVAWLLMALEYTGRRSWLAGHRALLLAAIPFTTLLLVFTNEAHGLIWRRFDPVPGQARVALAYGPGFVVHALYSYAIVLVGSALLFARFAASPLTRPAVVLALLGPIGVLISNLVHVLQPLRLPIDPTPTALAVALALLVWAITRHQMFTLVPVARGVTLESLSEGMLVIDAGGRVVDLNPAAALLLGRERAQLLGAEAASALGDVDLTPGVPRDVDVPGGRRVELRVSEVRGPEHAIGSVLLLRDVTSERRAEEALQAANRELERLAHTDPLTGLANRRRLLARLDEEWGRAERHGQPLSLVLVDLDHFKRVNDERGHLAGDRALAAAGRELMRLCRPEDVAARHGGEELCVLLPQTDLAGATSAALRLWSALRELVHEDETGGPFRVTASLGVAQREAADATPNDMIARADRALYDVKAGGRDDVGVAAGGRVTRVAPRT